MITIFDFIIFTILAIFSLSGLYRGLIHIVIYFIGFVASIIGAIFLYPYIDILVEKHVHNQLLASILGGGASYLVSFFFFTLISSITARFFRTVSRGLLDRLFGFILGTVKGLLIVILLFSVTAIFTSGTYSEAKKVQEMIYKLEAKKYPLWLKESITVPYLEKFSKLLVSSTPEKWLDYLNSPEKEDKAEPLSEEMVQIQRSIKLVRNRMQKLHFKKIIKNNYR